MKEKGPVASSTSDPETWANRLSEELRFADALRLAMQKEKAAFRLYMGLAEVTSDQRTRAVLLSLAEDEARQRLLFEVELEHLTKLEEELALARRELLGD